MWQEGLTDDLVGLSRDECKGVYRWLTFFEDKDKYFYAGKLVGRFFDRAGRPTPALKDFIECAEVAKTEGADGCVGCSLSACPWRSGWADCLGRLAARRPTSPCTATRSGRTRTEGRCGATGTGR